MSRSLCITFDWNLCLFLLRNCFTFFQLYNNQARKMRAKSSGQTKTNTNRDIWQLCVRVCVSVLQLLKGKRQKQNKKYGKRKQSDADKLRQLLFLRRFSFHFFSLYFIYICAHLLLMLLLLSSCAITTTSQICNNKKTNNCNGSEAQHLATP